MIGRALIWISRAAEIARTRRKLAMIEDDRLDDLGLTRADALAEAGRPFWDHDRMRGPTPAPGIRHLRQLAMREGE